MWTALGDAAIVLTCAYGGMVVFAFYYGRECDPVEAGVGDGKIHGQGKGQVLGWKSFTDRSRTLTASPLIIHFFNPNDDTKNVKD